MNHRRALATAAGSHLHHEGRDSAPCRMISRCVVMLGDPTIACAWGQGRLATLPHRGALASWNVSQRKDLTWCSESGPHSTVTGTDLAWLPDCSVPVLAVCSNEGYVQLFAGAVLVYSCVIQSSGICMRWCQRWAAQSANEQMPTPSLPGCKKTPEAYRPC